MKRKTKKILFAVQYPKRISPGQRFRFELYEDVLSNAGFEITTKSFLDQRGYNIIHKRGLFILKFLAIARGFICRFRLISSLKNYDYIFLQRELAPIGPPVLEWLFMRVFKKKLIYDFDDAIWIPQSSSHNKFAEIFRNTGKVKTICKWAYKVSCGSEYLCDFARQYNDNVVYNPTCVNTSTHHNIMANHDVERITIGWTGSFSTLGYFYPIIPVFKKLELKYDFDVKVICNKKPATDLKNLIFIEWSPENEVSELATCQIGIMPLVKNAWTEGKCGFKIIQYMALEIPAVSSIVGVNKIIVDDGINGFLCNTEEEWYNALAKLIEDRELRKRMGVAGRMKILKNYSVASNTETIINLFS